jgi:hypothetical protein
MTVSTSVRKAGPFTGDGSTTSFPFEFKVFSTGDPLVVETTDSSGDESTLTLSADYSVTLNSDQDNSPGGTVVLSAALASGKTLVITSQVSQTQEVDLTNQASFYPSVLNTEFDKLTILIQQAQEQIDRCLRIKGAYATGFDTSLPVPSPLSVLAWNADGTALVNSSPSDSTSATALATDLAGVNGARLVGNAAFYLADASAANVTGMPDGAVVLAAGIGGDASKSGMFKYLSASTATVDGVNILAPTTGSGRLSRLLDLNGTLVESIRTAVPVRNFKAMAAAAPFNVEEFKSSGTSYYNTALQDALDAANTYGNDVKIGPGTFNFNAPFSYSMPSAGLQLKGAGVGRTILNFPNAAAGEVEMYLYSSTDWYDFVMSDMSLTSAHAGTLLKLGKTDFSDPLNVAHLSNLAILNSKADNAAIALDLNYVVNSVLDNVRANCYANGSGLNYGYALRCNQVEFTHFNGGSYGNSSYGISFLTGYSFGNVFSAIDNENTNIGIYNGSANSGLHTFIGGQFSLWQQYLLQAPTGIDRNRIHLIHPNISSTTNVIDTSNCVGIEISGTQIQVTTPSVPSSSTTYRNTTGRAVQVAVWGGTVSAISINGYGIGVSSGTFILRPGETIALTYTATPSWYWYSIS